MQKGYEFCILTDEEDIIEYEKEMFTAFNKINPNYWICKHYKIIDNCRFQSEIPYKDQLIFAVKKNNRLIAAAAVNINQNNLMQFEKVGFSKPLESKNKKICEVLSLYKTDKLTGDFFYIFIDLLGFLGNELKNRNFDCLYSTSIERFKPLYTSFGSKVIDEKILDEEKKYLQVNYLNEDKNNKKVSS
ncbi:MAG: hypothetical protein A2086_00825 [Spirochaetes bacterium GWD1_27_9]|nr:MAG: hypothetical protein A2Z98_08820 [Spirochaetes bacterium GWB1_27_13]OHD28079.1 MAG: hypothetical protein A2Y34_02745 [Spirochaetes bacterium GWC1_27_15]OHD32552.1 MAG: hypothetical protein A2086_00825 [Spirochaetes bacterium GWD1_27_9]